MDLEWFQIHANVSNFEMASPKTIQKLKKLLIFVTPVKSCYIATILINGVENYDFYQFSSISQK